MLGCFRPLDGNNGSAFVRCLLHTVSVYFFMNPICIDLGSRNTRIATVSNGEPELFALKGNPSIPTFVYKGKCTAIGNDAVTAGERDSSYLFGNLVNLIGRSFSENDMSVLKSYLPCSVTDGKNHRCMVVGVEISVGISLIRFMKVAIINALTVSSSPIHTHSQIFKRINCEKWQITLD